MLNRETEDGTPYTITVIEEVLAHFEEDDYKIQSPVNEKIIREIQEGIEKNELRSGSFFFTLMDEELTVKVANALLEPYEISDWSKHNIFFSKEEEVLPKLISDTMIRHKREYVVSMIQEIKESLKAETDNTEQYVMMMKLNELRKEMDAELYRIL